MGERSEAIEGVNSPRLQSYHSSHSILTTVSCVTHPIFIHLVYLTPLRPHHHHSPYSPHPFHAPRPPHSQSPPTTIMIVGSYTHIYIYMYEVVVASEVMVASIVAK
eukprot:GHVN01006874.1.p1 GENE.GHVN01006874.1~~GHVN01006874.1.p1  ORF type:complete len:106 (+),score=33.37 GHVN01006874.1:471-788(+)